MTYKTILVHLNDSRRVERVLEPAAQLAARFDSHLIGFHAYSAVPASPIPMASSALGSIVAAERRNSEVIADTFKRITSGKPYVAEWQLQKVPHVDLAPLVLPPRHSTTARAFCRPLSELANKPTKRLARPSCLDVTTT